MTSQNKEFHLDRNLLDRNFVTQLDDSELELVRGGATVNFDLDTYLFTIGAGAVFNGGVTTNVVNASFNSKLFTES